MCVCGGGGEKRAGWGRKGKKREKADGGRMRWGWFNLFTNPAVPVKPHRREKKKIWPTDHSYNCICFLYFIGRWPAWMGVLPCQWCKWIWDNSKWSIWVKFFTWADFEAIEQLYYLHHLYSMKDPTLKFYTYELLMWPEFKSISLSWRARLEVPLIFNS